MLPGLMQLPQAPASNGGPTAARPAQVLHPTGLPSPAAAKSLVPSTTSLSSAQEPSEPQMASTKVQSPATQGTAPKAVPGLPVMQGAASSQPDGGGSFPVVAMGQCGGSTSYCASLQGDQCKDAPWEGAQVDHGFLSSSPRPARYIYLHILICGRQVIREMPAPDLSVVTVVPRSLLG